MILVMGASGQLGGKVIEHLLEWGARPSDIVAGVRTPDRLRKMGVEKMGVEYHIDR